MKGNLLEAPKTEKLHCESFTSSCGLQGGATGMQGWRLEMEDSHIVTRLVSIADHSLVAIFDGHGGAGAAKYASEHLIEELENTAQWKAYCSAADVSNSGLIGNALIAAFLNIDAHLRQHQLSDRDDTSGCTAVAAIITPKYIICSNAGDSRCVMGTADQATKPLSFDHKPTDELERERIQAAGGSVQWKRVDGDLAVSRALGDFQYKTSPELPPEKQKVTCFPDITVHERHAGDDVLILACDGVWDVFSSSDAVEHMRRVFACGERDMVLAADELIDMALIKGSRDNISAIVVALPGAVFGTSGDGVRGMREEREKERLKKENSTQPPALDDRA